MAILKRFAAPGFWPVEKKTKKFVISPKPGPHAISKCIPAGLIIRDVLGYARNLRETKNVFNKGVVKIDKKTRNEPSFPVGLMDVFTIGNEHYRVLPSKKGLKLVKIEENEASIKLCRIENKRCIVGKKQLNLHDGRNILVDKDDYKTGDTLVIDLEKNAIKDVIRMKRGSLGMIVSGRNAGKLGKIGEIIITRGPQPNKVVMRIGDESYEISKNYVFVVGHEKPVIKLSDM